MLTTLPPAPKAALTKLAMFAVLWGRVGGASAWWAVMSRVASRVGSPARKPASLVLPNGELDRREGDPGGTRDGCDVPPVVGAPLIAGEEVDPALIDGFTWRAHCRDVAGEREDYRTCTLLPDIG